jgi:uncharacterized protein
MTGLTRGLSFAGLLLTTGAIMTTFAAANAAQKNPKRVLVVTTTTGFRHDSIPLAREILKTLGDKHGWQTETVDIEQAEYGKPDTRDKIAALLAQKMSPDALKNYDAIVFANTTGVLPLPDPQAFLDFVKSGKGFVAMHSGSDTFHEWPGSSAKVSEYIQMLGGEFQTHHAQCAVDGIILDGKHPATKPLVKAGKETSASAANAVDLKKNTAATGSIWKAFDEIYILKNVPRADLNVLVYMDSHPKDGSADAGKPGEHLLSWCRQYGKGRVFYTALGHRQEIWRDPLYQEHIVGGIKFALGTAKGSTKPNPLTTK